MAIFTPVQGTADVALDAEATPQPEPITGLAAFIRERFSEFRNHRDSEGISDRLVSSLRQYNGEYSEDKLQSIRQFGGSEVFARLTTVKCRGATALLRDVFLGAERTWALAPSPVPTLPEDVLQSVDQLLAAEMLAAAQQGVQVDPQQVLDRRDALIAAAEKAAVRRAKDEAREAETYIDDILREGGFYTALSDFLVDLPIFPYAVLKGPVVRLVPKIKWVNGSVVMQQVPRMHWVRVSPDNVWFTPGAGTLEDASVIERIKVSRAELNGLLGLPGYFEDAVRAVLNDYDKGLTDWLSRIDQEMSDLQDKESPVTNTSELIDSLEFHGPVKGSYLVELGFTKDQVPDPDRDYHVTAWLIGRHVIKVQINPNPRAAKPYYTTAFEQVPGSITGHGIPEIINDVQDVANACLRSMVNNMSISSGPQVAINEDRLSASTDANSLYPWKRWRFTSDPMGTAAPPIQFFQPKSNAAELLAIYKEMQNVADETSAIPRYITGSEKVGGAASTASGLAMLMNNASKVLQNVAASIDQNVISPVLRNLYDMLMLTDTSGRFRGDENIIVRGVTVAQQKETNRARRLEFLQLTANPLDMEIIGPANRAKILSSIAEDLGLAGEDIVRDPAEIEQALASAQEATQAAGQHMAQTERPKDSQQVLLPGGAA